MSLRFVLGVMISALLANWWIGYEISRSHEIMMKQPIWQYMFVNIPWLVWVSVLVSIGVLKMTFLLFRLDTAARYACFASFVVMFLWFVLAGTAYFEGNGPRFTFLGPILILVAVCYESLFLVLSSVDVLDRIRFRRRQQGAIPLLVE